MNYPVIELIKREPGGYELFVDRNHVPGVFDIDAVERPLDEDGFLLPVRLRARKLIIDGREQVLGGK
jgi:hypothetical protein